MARAKTSARRAGSSRSTKSKAFNPKSFQGVELKVGTKLEEHDPDLRLKEVGLVREALLEALLDGDHEAFKEILCAHLETVNKDALSARSGVARTTLFRMLAPRSNPTLKNVAKVLKLLKAG